MRTRQERQGGAARWMGGEGDGPDPPRLAQPTLSCRSSLILFCRASTARSAGILHSSTDEWQGASAAAGWQLTPICNRRAAAAGGSLGGRLARGALVLGKRLAGAANLAPLGGRVHRLRGRRGGAAELALSGGSWLARDDAALAAAAGSSSCRGEGSSSRQQQLQR